MDLLDPASDVMKRSAPEATPEYQVHLLITLARLGLPEDRDLRRAAVGRIREALSSDLLPVYSAAAHTVVAVRPVSDEEARELVPLLIRSLAGRIKFREADERIRHRLPSSLVVDERLKEVPGLRALAALGKAAREALPAVKAIADRPLVAHRISFLPEPPVNAVIREARKTVEALE
jgi:hypothetical protein